MFWYPKEKDMDAVDSSGMTLRDFLAAYDPAAYERPAVTVDNVILKNTGAGLQILLVRRGRHPYYGMLALPGGFIEMDESLEDAAARELMEETGVTGMRLTQLGAYGTLGRDPRLRIVSVAYATVIAKEIEYQAGDDADDAGFYAVSLRTSSIGSDIAYELIFQLGAETAFCRIAEAGGKRTITESQLASDHGLMVLDALEKLGFAASM